MLNHGIFLSLAILSSYLVDASQPSANIYLRNPTSSSSSSSSSNIETQSSVTSITSSELNAFLSHHLQISQYESLPPSLHPQTRKSQLVFGSLNDEIPEDQDRDGRKSKRLIVIYGSDGQNLVTDRFVRSSQHLVLPSPPESLSFDGLISTYIGRMVESLSIPISSIHGLKPFLNSFGATGDGLKDWAKQWDKTFDDWLEWGKETFHITDEISQIEMVIEAKYSRWLTEYGAMDVSAKQFIQDLEMLDAYQESIASPSSLPPPLTLFRLSGLEQIVRQHGQHSPQYRLAISTLKKFLDGILSTPTESQTILIAVPPKPAHTRLGKRTSLSLLAPFQTSESSFVSRSLLDRRSEIFAGTSPKIVSSTRACYSNVTECEENTKTCNGHGACVMGQRTSGGNCFVCECKKEKKDGKVVGWSGEMCQKQDLSSEFVLISGSVIGLIIAFSMAIALLFSIGAEGLPQQLASVSGSSKKND